MFINPKNKKYVHHLVAYECDDEYSHSQSFVAQECGSVRLPISIASRYRRLVVSWGVGGPRVINVSK
jgi:hypothetical protein